MNIEIANAIIKIDNFLHGCTFLLDKESKLAWSSLVDDAIARTEEYSNLWGD
jgi:hypothetical protein